MHLLDLSNVIGKVASTKRGCIVGASVVYLCGIVVSAIKNWIGNKVIIEMHAKSVPAETIQLGIRSGCLHLPHCSMNVTMYSRLVSNDLTTKRNGKHIVLQIYPSI